MKTLIIYKSRTGFTKRYAQWIGEELACETEDYQNMERVDLDSCDLVIYGGRVHGGRIDGLNKMRELLRGKKCRLIVFATGATPIAAKEEIEKMMNENFSDNTIPHFYMQSGLCYEKMGLADKTLMKAFAKMLSGKKNKSEVEKGTASAISQSYDISDKSYVKDLVDFVKSTYGG